MSCFGFRNKIAGVSKGAALSIQTNKSPLIVKLASFLLSASAGMNSAITFGGKGLGRCRGFIFDLQKLCCDDAETLCST